MSAFPLFRFGFGCVALTQQSTASAAVRLLHAVRAAGLDYFDTAPIYGSGYSEILVGKFLRETREPVEVATKFGLGRPQPRIPAFFALPVHSLRRKLRSPHRAPVPTDSEHARAREPAANVLPHRVITRASVEASFNASRRALRRERIDHFFLHEGLPSFLTPEAWAFLQAQRRAGAIGKLGVAAGGHNYTTLTPADLTGWDVLQYEFGPAWPQHAALPERFPHVQHNFHSCLKDHRGHGSPGEILRACATATPRGRVLFSTRDIAHLHANLAAITGR